MEITKYVLGFAFDKALNNVVLIQKTKPDWQAGKLNGVGGKIEIGETSLAAMIREFEEETGVTNYTWTKYGEMFDEDWHVDVYYTVTDNIFKAQTTTEEKIRIVRIQDLKTNRLISNLHRLIPDALAQINLKLKEAAFIEKGPDVC